MRRVGTYFLLIAIIITSVLGYSTPLPAAAAAPKYGGALRWACPGAPNTPIGWPAEAAEASAFSMQLCLQTLLKEQADGSFTPCLATSYEVYTGPVDPYITFHLRQGVKFHDGTDFNAQAAKWNLDQVKAGSLHAATTGLWESIDAVDPYTLRVNLSAWLNQSVQAFAGPPSFMVSPTAFSKNGIDWMRWNMVGTGPFMQNNWQRDISLKTVRNPNYWETGKPYLDGVTLIYVPDEQTRLALFKSGGADVLECNNNGKMALELANAGYNIISQQGGPFSLIPDSANADSPWSNIKVRMAAEYAIDKHAMNLVFGYGYTSEAYQLHNSTSIAYDTTLTGRKYDMSKAKQLLAEAGYPSGFKTSIIAPNNCNRDVVVGLQYYLANAGIQAELSFCESALFTQIVKGTWKNALLCYPLDQWPNPNTAFSTYFGVPATMLKSIKKPEGWSSLLNASMSSLTPDPVLARNCEDALYNDVSVIPVFYQSSLWATTYNVKDTFLGARGVPTWWEPQLAWLEPVAADVPLSLDPAVVGPIGCGQTFKLDIKTSTGSIQQVSGVDAFIKFDPSKLEVVDMDVEKAGIQVTPGTALDTVIINSADNTGGLVSYSAGKLGPPFPSGTFTVASIQFRIRALTATAITPVTISLSGNNTASVVDFGGIVISGPHADASVRIVPGARVDIRTVLQGGSRPETGWTVPLTVKFFTPGTTAPVDVLNAVPVYTFNLITARSGNATYAQAAGVMPGTYDITAVTPHTLINVKRSVVISEPVCEVDLGVLLEGNTNDDIRINIQDFGILAVSYGKTTGQTSFDARADFDRNGIINIADFGLLVGNYARQSPLEAP
jgi:peptide/nickel transport system substrate-binding protein